MGDASAEAGRTVRQVNAQPMPALKDVIGQPGLTVLLARLIHGGRLPHAIMLEGVPGCGRRTLSRAVAMALLCLSPNAGDACGKCDSCRMARVDTHPDLLATPHDSDAEDLSVDLLRERIVAAAYESPLLSQRRAFIIHGAERLQNAAANVLLKALEEPPSGAYFILTSAHSSAVLKTIRSRTQLFRMQSLTAADVARILQRSGMEPAEAALRSMSATGSHRGLWGELRAVPLAELKSLFHDGLNSEVVARAVSALPSRLSAEEEEEGRTLAAEQRRLVRQWLTALAHELQRELRSTPTAELATRIERLSALQYDLDRNLPPRLVIEAVALDHERRARV
jgi:DNA polymerase III delta' subunit